MKQSIVVATRVETYEGRTFDLTDPDPTAISIVDIAHALGMQCRYNGHCKQFFSVAEHSVFCSRWLGFSGYSERPQMLALLHDAAEAYIGDLISPAKSLCPGFPVIEAKMQSAIYEALKVKPPSDAERDFMKLADNVALATETSALMPSRGEGWGLVARSVEYPVIECWPPAHASTMFIKIFSALEANAE